VRIPHANRADWAGKIADAWKRIEGKENAAVAGASVNPLLNEELEHIVERVTKRPLNWVGKQIDLPIKVLTDKPEETGVDRIVKHRGGARADGEGVRGGGCGDGDYGGIVVMTRGNFWGGDRAGGADHAKGVAREDGEVAGGGIGDAQACVWKKHARGDSAGGLSWDSGAGEGAGGELCDGAGILPDIIATGGMRRNCLRGGS